jgi:hypothetical protein
MGLNNLIFVWKLLRKTLFEKKLGHGQFQQKAAKNNDRVGNRIVV